MVSILIPSSVFLVIYWARYFLLTKKQGKKLPLILPLAFTCLFIPKVNLIQVNPDHSMAGIRTDDVLAFLMLVIALRDAHTWKNRKVLTGLAFLLALSVSNFISIFVGRSMGFNNAIPFSILFILRRFEYFAFVPIGIYLARKTENIERVALREYTWVFFFHVVIALLQVAGICNYATMGFVDFCPDYWQGYAISTFNGHYEYGQFLCFGTAIYLCVFLRTKKFAWLGMLAASFGMVWLTKCRSVMIVAALLIIIILFFTALKTRKRWLRISLIVIMVLILVFAVLVITGVINIGRFGSIDFEEYRAAWEYYKKYDELGVYVNYVRGLTPVEYGMGFDIKDGSAAGRFYKWWNAMDGFYMSPAFGYGTGVTQVMDGNYFKLLGEGGLIGTILWLAMFLYFMWIVWKQRMKIIPARSVFYMMVSVMLAAFFIDMFEASKPMEMLWLAIGMVIGIESLKPEESERAAGESARRKNGSCGS